MQSLNMQTITPYAHVRSADTDSPNELTFGCLLTALIITVPVKALELAFAMFWIAGNIEITEILDMYGILG